MTDNIIKEVVEELMGEDGVKAIMYLRENENVSEFTIAEKMKLDIQEARALLYRLYETNLVKFERKKDRQKGWYVTFWDYDPTNLQHAYKKLQEGKIEKLESRLRTEQSGKFYICKYACSRKDFDGAVETEFKCPECGSLMNPMDNSRTIEFINEKIESLRKAVSTNLMASE